MNPEIVSQSTDSTFESLAIYDISHPIKLHALLSLARTLALTIILLITVTCLNRATNSLLIHPIEQMISRVERISENPLKAAQEEEERLILEEILEMQKYGSELLHEEWTGPNANTTLSMVSIESQEKKLRTEYYAHREKKQNVLQET